MTLSVEDTALRYAAFGWKVIPVIGKRPVGLEWQKRASSDQAAVARMFSEHHDGVGVQLGQASNLIDFDCDSDEAQATFNTLFSGERPACPMYQSARGKHYLFRWTGALPQGSIKIVVDGLEIRLGNGAAGCQSVLPPSGGREWITWPDDCPPPEIPPAVIDRINARYAELHKPKQITPQPYQAGGSIDGSLNVPKWLEKHGREIVGRTEGGDGTTRYHITCPGIERHTTGNSWRDCCITQDAGGRLGGSCFHSSCGYRKWEDLRDAIGPLEYLDYHEPNPEPLRVDPFAETSVSVEEPPEWDDDEEEEPEPEATPAFDLGFPEELLRPAGLIGDFVDYVLQSAKYPQPEHTLAAGLSLMSLLTGRRVADMGGTRGNLMIVALGPTRSGKEHPRGIIKQILETCGQKDTFEEKIASEAALYGFLQKSHAGIFMNDEFGDWLALARSKSGPNTQPSRILTAMTMLYSSTGGTFKAPRYAENSKQVELNQPHLVFYGTSTGEVFWKHVTPEYLSGGLFGRVMLFENRGYVDPMPMSGRGKPLPESLVTDCREWFKFGGVVAGDMAWHNPTPVIVPHAPDALERFEDHELSISKTRKSESAIRAALWSGTAEITAKLALLFACSRSRNPLMITIADVEQAITLSNWLTRRKFSLCDDHVAENATEDASKRVFRLIKGAGKKGIDRSTLTRKTQWIKERDRADILKDLLAASLIHVQEVVTKTRTKTVFMVS